MSIPVRIEDQGRQVKVTRIGQLVTAPFEYDLTSFVKLEEDDTGYNFYGPKPGFDFVITGILAVGNKSITGSPAESVVVIYEASSSTSTVVDKELVQFVIAASQAITAMGLNTFVNEGVFLNSKCDNDDVYLTIFGYYIPA